MKTGGRGRKILDDLFLNEKHLGYKALVMIDLRNGEPACKFEDNWLKSRIQIREINYQDVIHALEEDADSDKAAFIQACFDDLFYYLNRIGFFLKEGLLTIKDVQSPLNYYAGKMAGRKQTFEEYMEEIDAKRALSLLELLPGWREDDGMRAAQLAAADRPNG